MVFYTLQLKAEIVPVLHKRTDSNDYYVKGRLDGGFITLQLVRPAKSLLSERFGYEDGDKIPWKVMTPLCMLGHAYSQSGGGPGGNASGKDLSVSINKLSNSQQQHIRQYLSSYENYTARERDWINTHIFDGSGTVSSDQVSEFPEQKQEPNQKVERLSSIWKNVIDGRKESNQDTSKPRKRSEKDRETNETATGTTALIHPSEIELGSTLRVPVNRISNAGNVIVEVDDSGHLNLGDIPDVGSGDEIKIEVVSTPEQGEFKANHVPESDPSELD